jgi:regulator of sirC expression with transglutaminase-like and TPR domain
MDPVIARFTALSARPDAELDLVDGALEISRLFQPGVDGAQARARLDGLGDEVRDDLADGANLAAQVDALNRLLFGRFGFAGNCDDFNDPRNSFLDQVLERRVGIPISLSLVYIEVARRAGVAAWGVGFPGHFLVKLGHGGGSLVVDPFNEGAVLSADDLDARLAGIFGDDRVSVRAHPSLLRAATQREILVRMLRNLKAVYLGRGLATEALRAACAILALVPDLPEELRDRGLIYRELGHHQAALDDLRRFTALSNDGPEIAAVTAMIDELAARPMRVH